MRYLKLLIPLIILITAYRYLDNGDPSQNIREKIGKEDPNKIPQEFLDLINSMNLADYSYNFIINELKILQLYLKVDNSDDFNKVANYSKMINKCSRILLKTKNPKMYGKNFSRFMQEQRKAKRALRALPRYQQLKENLNITIEKYQGLTLPHYKIPCSKYNKKFNL